MNKHAHVVRNILALLLNQIGTWTVTFILTLVVPPYLGINLYGLYAFVNSFTALFALGMTLGTGTYLTWRIAREPEEIGQLTFNTLILQVPLAVLSSAAALLIMPHMDSSRLVIELTIVGLASTFCSALVSTCLAALAGQQNMRVPSLIGVSLSFVGAGMTVMVVHLHASVIVLVTLALFSQVILLTTMLVYTQHKIHMRPRLDLRLWRTIVLGSLPFCGWSAVLLVYGQIDVSMLKVLVGDTAVGWYAVASRIVSIPVFLPTIVITAILPALAHERDAMSPHFRALASRSIRLVSAVGIPACVGTALLATHIIELLHYPATFQPAGTLATILALGMPLIGLDMVLGTVLIALGKQKAWTGVGVIAAVFNPIANLWAIPFTQHTFGDGAIGAGVITVATEVLMFGGALVLRPRTIFTGSDVFYIVRCLLAAAIMVPGVWALSALGIQIIAAVAYGLILYAMAAYTLQVVTTKDLVALLGVLGAKLGMNDEPADVMAGMLSLFQARPLSKTLRRRVSTGFASSRTAAAALGHRRHVLAGTVLRFARTTRMLTMRSAATVARPLSTSLSQVRSSLTRLPLVEVAPPLLEQLPTTTSPSPQPRMRENERAVDTIRSASTRSTPSRPLASQRAKEGRAARVAARSGPQAKPDAIRKHVHPAPQRPRTPVVSKAT